MKTSRLKSIILIILAIANLFLLLLLLTQWQSHRRQQETLMQQLVALYEKNGVRLSEEQIPTDEAVTVYRLSRSDSAQQALAELLLGDTLQRQELGSTVRYQAAEGSCLFRADGTFLCERSLPHPVSGEELIQVLEEVGQYLCAPVAADFSGTSYGVQSTAELGLPLLEQSVQLRWENGQLVAMEGVFLSPQEPVADGVAPLSPATALVQFLDHRNAAGIVCTELRSLSLVYQPHSLDSTTLQLLPLLRLVTDEASYLVSLSTGDISRISE